MSQPTSIAPELFRSAFKSSFDLMDACLGGVERMQNYQAEALGEIRAAQSDMAKTIGGLRTLEEMQVTQAELARNQFARMTGYWSGLYATMCQNQVEMLKEAQASMQEIGDELSQKLEVAPPGSESVVSALKLVVGAAQSTYAATVRATEEMVRISAAQAEAANVNATAGTVARQARAKRAA